MAAYKILVSDTISEIMERMSSKSIFGENMKKHLNTLKEKCSAQSKLNLKDNVTREWLGNVSTAVTELFYLVDDLCADAVLLQNQSKIASLFSAFKPTLLHQFKEIEKKVDQLNSESSLKEIKMSTNEDANSNLEEEEEEKQMLEDFDKLGLDSWRLRQCLAYCSFIFSETDLVKTETLIRLWMAEGFMGHEIKSQPEDIALDCMKEFQKKEIFQQAEDGTTEFSFSTGGEQAESAAGNENLYVKDYNVEEVSKEEVRKRVQRVVLDSDLDVSNGIPKPLFEKVQVKQIRTFFLSRHRPCIPHEVRLNSSACHHIFSKFIQLRVLTLTGLGIERLPPSIGGLKRLRYLDLSLNNMTKLPNSIGELKHLQTLMLADCYKLKTLPDGPNHFPSLRHLVLDQCINLKRMPSVLSKLTCLRTLSLFVVTTRKGLQGLLPLNNLKGELEISHLEQFKLKNQSKSMNPCFYVKHKQYLQCLTLRWNHQNYWYYDLCSTDKEEEQIQVLSQLEPHPNLQKLSIKGYKGNRFPGWLPSSLKTLVEISLYHCSKCQCLPSLHQITTLKKLTLMSMDSLQFVTNGDKVGSKLEKVKISDCPNLIGWWKEEEEGTQNNDVLVFTSLTELVLEYCPKLLHMPLFPNLEEKLVLDSSNLKPLLNTLTSEYSGSDSSPPLSKLTEMTIINVDREQYPPPDQELLKHFTSLEILKIMDCQGLKSIKGWKHLTSLNELHISNCTEIDLPEDEWKGLKWLWELVIKNIPDLQNLPEGIKHLTFLTSLHLLNCPKLKALTPGIHDLLKHQFQFLYLEDCPVLESLYLERQDLIIMEIKKCPLLETKDKGQQVENLAPPFPFNN